MKVPLPRLLVCVAVLTLLFSGCRKDKAGNTAGEQPGEKPSENVVAMIGDEAITEAELEATLKQLPERKRDMYHKRTIHYLVDTKIYSDEAKNMGLDEDPEVREDLKRTTKKILARYFVTKRVEPEAEPSQEAVKKYYEEHTDQFVVPEGVLVRRIVVREKEDAEATLQALKEGTSFEALSRKTSGPRSRKKGKREWLYRGRMEPELEKVAFALEKEKPSDIIKIRNGYQIIKVLEKSDERQIGFEQAKSRIRLRLLQQKKRELIHQYYEKAGVERNPGEGVLVKVGDEAFTEEDLAPILAKAKEKDKEKIKQRWIQYFIETTVFSGQAKKVGLENDPEVAGDIKRRKDDILAKAFRKRVIGDKIRVSDEEIAAYYGAHSDEFSIPLRLRLRLIVVKTREEAEEILNQIKGGAAFSYLARRRSIHPSSQRGGELGWFSKGEKDPVLEKAALALEKYEISDIIETERGYEIIRLMGKHGGGVRPLEEVHDRIKMALTKQRMEKERQRYYEKAGVKVFG